MSDDRSGEEKSIEKQTSEDTSGGDDTANRKRNASKTGILKNPKGKTRKLEGDSSEPGSSNTSDTDTDRSCKKRVRIAEEHSFEPPRKEPYKKRVRILEKHTEKYESTDKNTSESDTDKDSRSKTRKAKEKSPEPGTSYDPESGIARDSKGKTKELEEYSSKPQSSNTSARKTGTGRAYKRKVRTVEEHSSEPQPWGEPRTSDDSKKKARKTKEKSPEPEAPFEPEPFDENPNQGPVLREFRRKTRNIAPKSSNANVSQTGARTAYKRKVKLVEAHSTEPEPSGNADTDKDSKNEEKSLEPGPSTHPEPRVILRDSKGKFKKGKKKSPEPEAPFEQEPFDENADQRGVLTDFERKTRKANEQSPEPGASSEPEPFEGITGETDTNEDSENKTGKLEKYSFVPEPINLNPSQTDTDKANKRRIKRVVIDPDTNEIRDLSNTWGCKAERHEISLIMYNNSPKSDCILGKAESAEEEGSPDLPRADTDSSDSNSDVRSKNETRSAGSDLKSASSDSECDVCNKNTEARTSDTDNKNSTQSSTKGNKRSVEGSPSKSSTTDTYSGDNDNDKSRSSKLKQSVATQSSPPGSLSGAGQLSEPEPSQRRERPSWQNPFFLTETFFEPEGLECFSCNDDVPIWSASPCRGEREVPVEPTIREEPRPHTAEHFKVELKKVITEHGKSLFANQEVLSRDLHIFNSGIDSSKEKNLEQAVERFVLSELGQEVRVSRVEAKSKPGSAYSYLSARLQSIEDHIAIFKRFDLLPKQKVVRENVTEVQKNEQKEISEFVNAQRALGRYVLEGSGQIYIENTWQDWAEFKKRVLNVGSRGNQDRSERNEGNRELHEQVQGLMSPRTRSLFLKRKLVLTLMRTGAPRTNLNA